LTNKVKLMILLAITAILLLISFLISSVFMEIYSAFMHFAPPERSVKETRLKTSISPDGRWRVKICRTPIVSWPIDEYYYYAKVTDLKGRVPTHPVSLESSEFKTNRIRWRSTYTVEIFGEVFDIRTGSSQLEETTVSPDGRWRVSVYHIEPGGILDPVYAKVTDSRGRVPTRNIELSGDSFLEDKIFWKNANTINIFGEVVDLRTK